ncbi:hypothetical protein IKC_04216 [Bacillus cereus VD184]|uniref:Uncharacterized protein n=3 Tax=Bacillus cereus group TaxID=86661 RepID=A0A0J1HXH8_BACAN|nr:hypothetical protein [Stenotrophomonas maltophilia group sp. RNC7]EOQ19742.1 hypothetical protein IKC_04216 [Bacillus cereus VD184]KLV18396.1 hypothetical protein ABW01_13555 [Bacillus anthracis]ONG72193.1 hypothetical protein BKK44_10425 [Bacillus cereus]OUB76922.1 hypothetical protein BK750_03350 [Bacillus thuringiensis serovar jegathesan]MDQ4679852.1 hypothetical protein [Stenotrophomonas maltophilia group sp. RNC7]
MKKEVIFLQPKSIHCGCYVSIIPELYINEPVDGIVITNKALNIHYNLETETLCDRSDIAQLNIEYQNGSLEILETLEVNALHDYTHIIKDTYGFMHAVQIKDGDWTSNFL